VEEYLWILKELGVGIKDIVHITVNFKLVALLFDFSFPLLHNCTSNPLGTTVVWHPWLVPAF
jgi:hypothetical protein